MGVSFTIMPLAEFYQEEGKEFLRDNEVELPAEKAAGRYPTISETRTLLENKQDLIVKYSDSPCRWRADARLDVGNLDDVPIHYFSVETLPVHDGEKCVCTFDGEYDMVKSFVEDLAKLCGPFVLLIDGESPRIIGN